MVKQRAAKFQNLTECDIIEGHLIISAMDEAVAVNYTFPKLREVTEYVILYQAQNIVKLNNLFPNLAVIRGNKLVMVSVKNYNICENIFIQIFILFKGLCPRHLSNG